MPLKKHTLSAEFNFLYDVCRPRIKWIHGDICTYILFVSNCHCIMFIPLIIRFLSVNKKLHQQKVKCGTTFETIIKQKRYLPFFKKLFQSMIRMSILCTTSTYVLYIHRYPVAFGEFRFHVNRHVLFIQYVGLYNVNANAIHNSVFSSYLYNSYGHNLHGKYVCSISL